MLFKTIGMIGGGTMGHGIAASFAINKFKVNVLAHSQAGGARIMPAIEEECKFLVEENYITAAEATAALGRVTVSWDKKAVVEDCEFVLESIPEKIELKQSLFAELDQLCKPEAVLASNTSSLKLADMMAQVSPERRKRMMVTHWYNPPLLMPIVELSCFGNMAEDLYNDVAKLHETIGKVTVKVLKDVPGLVANRIQQAVAREAFSIIEQQIAAAEDVDKALKFGPAFRYATTGQLEVADLGGLDVWCTVGDNLLAIMDASKQANSLLRKCVTEGKLGVKSGEGFYKYDPATVGTVKKKFMKRLLHQLKASKAYL